MCSWHMEETCLSLDCSAATASYNKSDKDGRSLSNPKRVNAGHPAASTLTSRCKPPVSIFGGFAIFARWAKEERGICKEGIHLARVLVLQLNQGAHRRRIGSWAGYGKAADEETQHGSHPCEQLKPRTCMSRVATKSPEHRVDVLRKDRLLRYNPRSPNLVPAGGMAAKRSGKCAESWA